MTGILSLVTFLPLAGVGALVLLSALALLWRNQHPRAVLVVTLALSLALAALSYGVVAGRVISSPVYRAASTYAKLHKRFTRG